VLYLQNYLTKCFKQFRMLIFKLVRVNISSNLPAVPTMILPPFISKDLRSSLTVVPPTNKIALKSCELLINFSMCSKICEASSLVGLIISEPMSCLPSFLLHLLRSISKIGMTYARVFPEPVTASHTTSLHCYL